MIKVRGVVGLHTTLRLVHDFQIDNVDFFFLDFKKVVEYFLCSGDIIEFGCVMHACKQMLQISFQNSHVIEDSHILCQLPLMYLHFNC